MSNDWYTAEQLAKFLKTTPAEIYRLGRAKKLERTRIKGKLYFRYDPQVQIGDAGTITRRAKFLGATDRLIEKYHNHPWVLSIAAISSIIGLVWAFMPIKKAEHPPSISSEITQVNNQNFQDTPNVRATYYRIEGAILLDRAMNGFGFSPADGFALRPVWLKNDVYQNLQGLIELCKRDAEQTDYQMTRWYAGTQAGKELWYADVETYAENVTESAPRSAKRAQNPKEFYRGRKVRDPLKEHIASTLSIDDLMLRVQTDPHWWVMSESQAPIIPFDQFQIFGPLNASEASQHTSDPITKAIATANSQIRDLAFLTTYFQHDGYQDLTSVRELKMLVLDIENVGDKPIGLVALKQKVAQTDQAYRLVSRAEQQTTLSKAMIAETALPLELLRPNEHLFVPLSIEFGFATNPRNREIWNQEQYMEKSRLPKDWWTSRVEEAIPFELVRGADRRGYPIISIVTISKSNLDSKPPFESHIEPTYFIGSSIDVQEVVFRTGNGIPTPWKVRRFEPNNLIARGAFEGGSCPILFYKDGVSGTVKRIGPILINAVTRSRQQTVQILVNGNVDTFVLEESQPETSFIDQVSLEVTDENGRRSIVSAEGNTLIRQLDRRFAILRQGSKLHINFRVPEHLKKANRQLKISGFYIPDSMIKD